MKFKAGDKVRYTGICETFSGKKGGYKPAEGVVIPSSRVGGVTELRLTTPVNSYPTGSKVGLFTTNLELINPEPKKGDKVEVLYPGYAGKTGVIRGTTDNYFYVKLDDSTRELLLTAKEFKIIEEKETKVVIEEEQPPYKVGDKIEFTENFSSYADKGDTAVVTKLQKSFGEWLVHYKLDKNGDKGDVFPKRIKKVEPFTYKDIQKGDTIRRTETWDSGTVKVTEGVATALDSTSARTKEGLIVGYYRDTDNPHMELELINRPEKPKHWLDEKPVGVVGLFGMGRYKKTLKKTAEDMWEVTFLINNLKHNMTSEACRDQWPSLNYENDDKVEWLR